MNDNSSLPVLKSVTLGFLYDIIHHMHFYLVCSSLRPLDVEFMKALHEKVNIVPVLAKADTLTPSEVKKKKMKVKQNIILHVFHLGINVVLALQL